MSYRFPSDFIWGAATASYQIEGAAKDDGKGPSIWDTFTHQPGHIEFDHTGDVSADHYHRYKEDVQLMKWLGIKAYRFSISWPRVLPKGRGQVNAKGMDFYSRLVDELLANGIEPWITLYHWDLPQALQDDYNGWLSRDTANYFGEYAACAAAHLSDRVTRWFTVNEFGNVIDGGYYHGNRAPGRRDGESGLVVGRHYLLLGQALAVRGLRQAAKRAPSIGFADDLYAPIPLIETDENIKAARACLATKFYTATILTGRYPGTYASDCAKHLPKGWEEDMSVIGTPVDFVGANCYGPIYVLADPSSPDGFRRVAPSEGHPTLGQSWLVLDPDSLYWVPRLLKELWNVKEVVISENGATANIERMNSNKEVLDTHRVMYLRTHLRAAQRAAAEGYPIKGYFHWTLMDNFEWNEGYGRRFGLFYVNFQTLERTPKLSARAYREIIRKNGFD
jgi:beta-glucosidase